MERLCQLGVMPQKITEITSRTNPRIKQLVKLRNGRKRRAAGVVLAEGVREVSRALMAGLKLREIYICEPVISQDDATQAAITELCGDLANHVQRFSVSREIMEKICYLDAPEGILAIFEAPNWGLEMMSEMLKQTQATGEGFTSSNGHGADKKVFLVCVQMEKPGNVGAMVRTAASAGIDGVIAANAAGYPVDIFHPNAIRTSTAAVFDLPTISADENEVIDWLVENHIKILAATPAGAVDYREADYANDMPEGNGVAIVIGPEDRGLSEMWLDATDKHQGQRVVIPNQSKIVDSLNASNAAAILMYEAMRQHSL